MYSNNILNKINLDLDNYYNEPYYYNKPSCKINYDDDLNAIINNLTSIILNGHFSISSSLSSSSSSSSNLKSKSKLKSNLISNCNIDSINIFKLIANNQYDNLKILLENNFTNINIQDSDGDTPLHIAVFMCNDLICELLLTHKADITIKDKWGQTALHRICFCLDNTKLIKIIKLFIYYSDDLLKYNNFNQTDIFGNTPLHLILKHLIKNKNLINSENIEVIRKLKIFTNCKISNKDNQTINDLLYILKLF